MGYDGAQDWPRPAVARLRLRQAHVRPQAQIQPADPRVKWLQAGIFMTKDEKMLEGSMGCSVPRVTCSVCGVEVGVITNFEKAERVRLWCPKAKAMTIHLVRPAQRPLCIDECCCPTISLNFGPCVGCKESGGG
jgi:hypothetical protein